MARGDPVRRVEDRAGRRPRASYDEPELIAEQVGLLEEMLVGQVVFGHVLATLRRLAEEHRSLQRFGDD
jgi:hypothetical protein